MGVWQRFREIFRRPARDYDPDDNPAIQELQSISIRLDRILATEDVRNNDFSDTLLQFRDRLPFLDNDPYEGMPG